MVVVVTIIAVRKMKTRKIWGFHSKRNGLYGCNSIVLFFDFLEKKNFPTTFRKQNRTRTRKFWAGWMKTNMNGTTKHKHTRFQILCHNFLLKTNFHKWPI